MMMFFAIALGGAHGAVSRYAVSLMVTTFSSFALDAMALLEKGQGLLALGYVSASVVLSLAAFIVMVLVSCALMGGQ